MRLRVLLAVAGLGFTACAGSLVRYLDVGAGPDEAVAAARSEAAREGFEAVARGDAGLRVIDSDAGFAGDVFAAELPDGGARLELVTPEGGPLIWATPASATTVRAITALDPGWVYPFVWDVGVSASLSRIAGAPDLLTWRGDAFARGGFARPLATVDGARWSLGPMLGLGFIGHGKQFGATFGFRPQLALSLARQELREELAGRPQLTGARWGLELAVALLLKEGGRHELEGELCVSSSRWGGPCARVGAPVAGAGLTWSVGYRLGAEPSLYVAGGALVAALATGLVLLVIGGLASAWPGGG